MPEQPLRSVKEGDEVRDGEQSHVRIRLLFNLQGQEPPAMPRSLKRKKRRHFRYYRLHGDGFGVGLEWQKGGVERLSG